MRTLLRTIDAQPDPEATFTALFGAERHAFWLDSASLTGGARFSYLGAPGPLGYLLTYEVEGQRLRIERPGGEMQERRESVFAFLERELGGAAPEGPSLPFDFGGGFVGCLGYELKAECGGEAAHRAPSPDAALIFADRIVVLDHLEHRVHLLALTDDAHERNAERWFDSSAARVTNGSLGSCTSSGTHNCPTVSEDGLELGLARSRERYLEDIETCRRYLRAGDSYEICLTNRVSARTAAEPLQLYGALRRANPAPHAAFLRLGETSVLSSSPERFLRIGADGTVEAKPIKGTSRRGEDPEEDRRLAEALRADPKMRAENVTIVDLLRNDLGRVCEYGSVEVPRLMEVESFETVHQLVSTVRGRLRPGTGAAGCVRACFPPGSMTGAPKLRTMEILDQLEGEARGVYSGAIGWFGLGGGCELSVAIRTLVLDGEGGATVGAGGAIVLDSDPEREYEEMLLKAQAPLRALDPSLPADYRRIRFSASNPRVTPRKSIVSGAAATSAS